MSNTPIPNQFFQQRRFVGLDLYHPAQDLGPGHLQQADNLMCQGGELVTRPGKQGLLSAMLGAPIYAPLLYVREDGKQTILFTSGGKVYYVLETESFATPHEILIDSKTHFNLNSAQCSIIRSGKFAYITDGAVKLNDLTVQTDTSKIASTAHYFTEGDIGKQLKITTGTGHQYTDLTLQSDPSKVGSGSRPFVSASLPSSVGDVGSTLQIAAGTGFTAGIYTILDVDSGVATLNTAAGTSLASGGHGTLNAVGGTGFILGVYTIVAVSGGIATLDAPAGTASAANGMGTLSAPLYRVGLYQNATYVAEGIGPLLTPITPGAALTNTVIDPCSDKMRWKSYPALSPSTAMIPTYASGFSGASTHAEAAPPDGWQTGGTSMDFKPVGDGTNQAYFDIGAGASWVDWETPNATYASSIAMYTDLVLAAGEGGLQVTSATRAFKTSDAGGYLQIFSGSGFLIGRYAITSVVDGKANLAKSAGTAGSMGGHATLFETDCTISTARVFTLGFQTLGSDGTLDLIMIPQSSGQVDAVTDVNPPILYTDLVIASAGSDTATLSSAIRPFLSTDAGKVITITGGTGWTNGGYTILSVTSGVATLKGVPGAASISGGQATLGLEASRTHDWGSSDTLLDFPSSEVGNARQDNTLKVYSGNSPTKQSITYSFTSLASDFDFIRARLSSSGDSQQVYLRSATLQPVDVRLVVDTAPVGLRVSANNVDGGYYLGGCYIRRDYTAQDTAGVPVDAYTDLAIDASNPAIVTSVARPFADGDVGKRLIITGGTGFTAGYTKIASVSGGAAHLSVSAGTVSSIGGVATLLDFIDYSAENVISVNYDAPTPSGTIPFRLGFQPAGSNPANISWTNPVNLISDSTGKYLSCDISTVVTDIRQKAQYLYLQITADLPESVDLTNLFTFGPISASGNLSIGQASYSYLVTEVEDTAYSLSGTPTGNTTDGAIESEGSATSAIITPTGNKAKTQITLSEPRNSATNKLRIYRYGGVFLDSYPTARLIAEAPVWTDKLDAAYSNYVTWDHTTRTIVDDTPDSALFLATAYIPDRSAMLYGSQAVTEWQNRIWTASGSTLAGSWLVTAGQAAGLYFNSVNIPDDPYGAIKGVQVSVGGVDNDDIQALVPLGAMLIILKHRSVWMLTGTDGSNFQLSGHLQSAGVGCAAPKGHALVQNTLWLLAGDGVWEYDGGEIVEPKSLEIEPLLAPGAINGASPILPDRLAGCIMLYAGRRLYVFAPGSAVDAENTVAYCYDTRTEGWTRLLQMNVTGACTTSDASDSTAIYLGCSNGQLYRLAGEGDKNLPTDTASAVPFSMQTRGMGQEEEGPSYWAMNIATALYAAVKTKESTSLTFTVSAANCPSVYSQSYTVSGSASLRFSSITPDIIGDYIYAGVSGSTVTQSKITSLAIEVAEGDPG